MKVIFLEVCRNPEINKSTDTRVVSEYLKSKSIEFDIYSNDGIWPNRTALSRTVIASALERPGVKLVHLSAHGDQDGIVLTWTNAEKIRDRHPEIILTGRDIAAMPQWKDKIVVTASSTTTALVDDFLKAGALAVVSPDRTISWKHVNSFFESFYEGVASRLPIGKALAASVSKFPELQNITIHAKRNIDTLVVG